MKTNGPDEQLIFKTGTSLSDGPKRQDHIPGLLSLLAHVCVVTALIYLSVTSYTTTRKPVVDTAVLFEPSLSLPPSAKPSGGGGGGGTRQPTPASKGVLPRADDKQLVPPTPIITNFAPELIAEPTIISPQFTNLPPLSSLLQLGDPHGIIGPPSAGEGDGGGIGNKGKGRGVGDLNGPGGPGCCGGIGIDGPPSLRVGTAGVSPPFCQVQIEPNYSDDARKAHVQGAVLLAVTVQKDGSIEPNRVINSLGYGLDDEAKKVLNQWKCTAGRYNGQPVALPIQIQINFHLY